MRCWVSFPAPMPLYLLRVVFRLHHEEIKNKWTSMASQYKRYVNHPPKKIEPIDEMINDVLSSSDSENNQ